MLRLFFEKLNKINKKKNVRFNRIITVYIIKDFYMDNIIINNNNLYK